MMKITQETTEQSNRKNSTKQLFTNVRKDNKELKKLSRYLMFKTNYFSYYISVDCFYNFCNHVIFKIYKHYFLHLSQVTATVLVNQPFALFFLQFLIPTDLNPREDKHHLCFKENRLTVTANPTKNASVCLFYEELNEL